MPSEYIASVPPTGSTCYLQDKLPLELRIQIYSLLLVNPLLGNADEHLAYATTHWIEYDLHPAILRTCRMISDEASKVLYSSNKFCILFLSCGKTLRAPSASFTIVCPVTRNAERFPPNNLPLKVLDSLKKVHKWELILSSRQEMFAGGSLNLQLQLVDFTLAILDSCHTLELGLVRQPARRSAWHHSNGFEDSTPYDKDMSQLLIHFLAPLRVLNKVREFSFTDSIAYESARNGRRRRTICDRTYHKISHVSEERLVDEFYGSMVPILPSESAMKMHVNVLKYAQCFERCDKYKKQMDRKLGWEKYQLSNPFTSHPVETALWESREAVYTNDVRKYKILSSVYHQIAGTGLQAYRRGSIDDAQLCRS